MDSLRIAAAMAGGGRLGDVEVNNQHVSIDTGMIKITGSKQERLGSTPRKSCCQGKAFTIPGFAKDQDFCLDSIAASPFKNNWLR